MPKLLSWLSSSRVVWFIAYSAVEVWFVAKNGGATEDAMLAVARLSRVRWISWAVSCICLDSSCFELRKSVKTVVMREALGKLDRDHATTLE
jgi:hypothetical protein